ncbi:hypothetical protein IJ818_05435 [bacterium]|nr:hypothetical protein [bacterium]
MTTINSQNAVINSNVKKNNVSNELNNNNKTSSVNEQTKSYGVTNVSDDSPEMIITDDASDVNEAKDEVTSMKENGANLAEMSRKLLEMADTSIQNVGKSKAEVSFIAENLTSECEEVKKYNEQALKKEENEINNLKNQIESNNKRLEELSNKEKNGQNLSSSEKSEMKSLDNINNTLSNRLNNRKDVTVNLDASDIDNMAAKLSEATGVAQDATEVADEMIDYSNDLQKMNVNEYISQGDFDCNISKSTAKIVKDVVGAVHLAVGKYIGYEALELADEVVDVAFEKNIEIADKSSLNNLANKDYGQVEKYVEDYKGNYHKDGKTYSNVTVDGKMKNADKLKQS